MIFQSIPAYFKVWSFEQSKCVFGAIPNFLLGFSFLLPLPLPCHTHRKKWTFASYSFLNQFVKIYRPKYKEEVESNASQYYTYFFLGLTQYTEKDYMYINFSFTFLGPNSKS